MSGDGAPYRRERAQSARQGTKEGVVRYVLLASLVLVVVLFMVAYELFS
jgi:hypothetical protein